MASPLRILRRSLGALLVAGFAVADGAPSKPIEDFSLPSVPEGRGFRLSEQRGKFVALHFLLKTECPFCLKHTHTYMRRAAEVPGVVHVFIKPDTDEEIRSWAKDMPKDSVIHRDAGAALATRMGIPDGYAFHGQKVHYPALVIVDPEGREVFRHVGQDNIDRYRFDDFAKKIAELKATPAK